MCAVYPDMPDMPCQYCEAIGLTCDPVRPDAATEPFPDTSIMFDTIQKPVESAVEAASFWPSSDFWVSNPAVDREAVRRLTHGEYSTQ